MAGLVVHTLSWGMTCWFRWGRMSECLCPLHLAYRGAHGHLCASRAESIAWCLVWVTAPRYGSSLCWDLNGGWHPENPTLNEKLLHLATWKVHHRCSQRWLYLSGKWLHPARFSQGVAASTNAWYCLQRLSCPLLLLLNCDSSWEMSLDLPETTAHHFVVSENSRGFPTVRMSLVTVLSSFIYFLLFH